MTSHDDSDVTLPEAYASLTKHPAGSMRELWVIAFPLMLSLLSGNLMMFFDRLILARYATDAMNGAATAGMMFFTLAMAPIGVAAIAEVFVGRHNGAKEYKEAGSPVWQMLWFSAMTLLYFIPIAVFGADFLVGGHNYDAETIPYFRWIMIFGAFYPAVVALQGFFVGVGTTRLVLITTLAGNAANILLDILLVFGVGDWIPSLGVTGAAVATGLSQAIQMLILLVVFLRKSNRDKYGTGNYRFNFPILWNGMRIGVPSAMGHVIEVAAWTMIMRMMAELSREYLTMVVVGQSFYMLGSYAMEGLQKAVTAVAANLIGAKKHAMIGYAWWSAIRLLFLLSGAAAIPMLVFPEFLAGLFLDNEPVGAEAQNMLRLATGAAFWVWCYFIVDGITWISAGVLTAYEDTKFIAAVNGFTAWFCALLPIYLFVVLWEGEPMLTWKLTIVYGTINALFFTTRCRWITQRQ